MPLSHQQHPSVHLQRVKLYVLTRNHYLKWDHISSEYWDFVCTPFSIQQICSTMSVFVDVFHSIHGFKFTPFMENLCKLIEIAITLLTSFFEICLPLVVYTETLTNQSNISDLNIMYNEMYIKSLIAGWTSSLLYLNLFLVAMNHSINATWVGTPLFCKPLAWNDTM